MAPPVGSNEKKNESIGGTVEAIQLQIVKNWSTYKKGLESNSAPIANIDEDALAGYCDALGIAHSFNVSVPRTENEDLIYRNIGEKVSLLLHRLTV